jgi:hypothetical protein
MGSSPTAGTISLCTKLWEKKPLHRKTRRGFFASNPQNLQQQLLRRNCVRRQMLLKITQEQAVQVQRGA